MAMSYQEIMDGSAKHLSFINTCHLPLEPSLEDKKHGPEDVSMNGVLSTQHEDQNSVI